MSASARAPSSNCGNQRGRTTYGYDVNPAGIAWLEQRMLLVDPLSGLVRCDDAVGRARAHPDFQSLLANVREWVFLSLPIFRDAEHVLRSKHFKPDEHCWYFTRDGLVFAMKTVRLCAGVGKHDRDRARPRGHRDVRIPAGNRCIDYSALLYDPVYAELGVPATLTAAGTAGEVALTVIDDTRPKTITSGSAEVRSVGPGAFARIPELAENGIARDDYHGRGADLQRPHLGGALV